MEPGLRSAGLPMPGSIFAAGGDALAGLEAEGAQLRREGVEGGAAEAAEGEREWRYRSCAVSPERAGVGPGEARA